MLAWVGYWEYWWSIYLYVLWMEISTAWRGNFLHNSELFFFFIKISLCFLGCFGLWMLLYNIYFSGGTMLQRQQSRVYTIHVRHSFFHFAICFGLQVLWNRIQVFSLCFSLLFVFMPFWIFQFRWLWFGSFSIVRFGFFSLGCLLLLSLSYFPVSFTATAELLQFLPLFYVSCMSRWYLI